MALSNRSTFRRATAALIGLCMLGATMAPDASAQGASGRDRNAAYVTAIDRTMAMVYDDTVWDLAQRYGLDVVNVAWEDTGRYDNSSVGPNISDVTIQVPRPIPGGDDYSLALMPVIRYPNFSDVSADIDIDKLRVPVGNEFGEQVHTVSLGEYLADIGRYLSDSGGANRHLSLLAERDSHVLVSAQAAFLPVPEHGVAQFNPVIFNYQSYAGNPAVLTIVVTSEGTSATVIDNQRDGFTDGGGWGQRLFFNEAGQRASFTGERASDIAATAVDAEERFASRGREVPPSSQARGSEDNVVLIIQVPLEHEPLPYLYESDEGAALDDSMAPAAASDVENAVIGHGEVEGPFTELAGLHIERDPDFPVRVTVQFYKATATGEVTADDMATIAANIDRIYAEADYVGSLVTDGLTPRPTSYVGSHAEPFGWWPAFLTRWPRYWPVPAGN